MNSEQDSDSDRTAVLPFPFHGAHCQPQSSQVTAKYKSGAVHGSSSKGSRRRTGGCERCCTSGGWPWRALRRLDLCWPKNGMAKSGRKDEVVERCRVRGARRSFLFSRCEQVLPDWRRKSQLIRLRSTLVRSRSTKISPQGLVPRPCRSRFPSSMTT